MPSDIVLWAGFALAGLFIGVAYYALLMVRSTRKKLRSIEENVHSLEHYFDVMNEQIPAVKKTVSSKVNASDLEQQYSAFLSKLLRKKMVVKARG